jgi:hypothetical protein
MWKKMEERNVVWDINVKNQARAAPKVLTALGWG